ncbi:hypothetical protein [Floridanema evergladense]|uniref:Uncharacterized protein n=1 Tax=Floridaenema evergladense BLCC-F167 TaxID=3153639 RepID=A0ABV4WYV1_9CYAN
MTEIKDLTCSNSKENLFFSLWETVIERQEEAQWRYPDFVPLFNIRESYKGIEYSIQFCGLGEKAWEIERCIKQVDLKGFPIDTEWKPMEMLVTDLGTELDLIFDRFPNQSYLETELTKLVQQSKPKSRLNNFSNLLTTIGYFFTPIIVVMYFIISGQSNLSRLYTRSPEITINSKLPPDQVSCSDSKCFRQTFTYFVKSKNGEIITVNIEHDTTSNTKN